MRVCTHVFVRVFLIGGWMRKVNTGYEQYIDRYIGEELCTGVDKNTIYRI